MIKYFSNHSSSITPFIFKEVITDYSNHSSYISYRKNGLKQAYGWMLGNHHHRIDGPALIYNGVAGFFYRGKQFAFENWLEIVKDRISPEKYWQMKKHYGQQRI